ncbi:M23 family metallopeptidase [Paenibacillus alginolyticus]|uniref:Peptidoglycan DD-metalloendopeptidase family protein n=1 Tax=Paenibacillus alginolyticus TaxID=59839 RepID=A0ABT4G9F8_9BACL|nr:peptidoglycan DD-metalloendopeptidase family protein [Paenibacillus alginolyticus]MCY9692820.1 peptidoglycan DD-metalloendopeptidase family protein [Paenibacillus alginolyticus]MEC0148415.1 peptidoglycan DD-metalloendopeptidase family protein [Paenibacillus alginolyticus]
MKLNWKPKKLTLVIIPDANQSVVRFRIPHLFAYIAAACLSVLLLISIITYAMHASTLKEASALQSKLTGANQQWSAALNSKDKAIEQLQNEVIQLSQQAEQMKTKVEEMKKFESDLKSIAGIDANTTGTAVASTSAGTQDKPADADGKLPVLDSGIGGSPNPASQEDIIKLGEQTLASFTALNSEVNELQTSLTVTKQKVADKQQLLRITPTLWPTTTKVVTSTFGYRTDPFTHRPSFHSGIDFGARENDPVYATADGKVVSTGNDMFHGNNIVIEHSKGLRTWYMHLNKILVNKGDSVEKGSSIGLVGSTGRSTGPHLHYEVLKNGESIDPKPYLSATRKDE